MDMSMIFKAKSAWNTFCNNHPKFPQFLNAAKQKGIKVGTVIDITITTEDGQTISTNLKVTESDMELFNSLK